MNPNRFSYEPGYFRVHETHDPNTGMPCELWKHYRRAFSGYHFSNFGRILGRKGVGKGDIDRNGYVRVVIEHKHYMLHRLIGHLWVDGYRRGLVINHKDGNKQNNRPENLEWVTQKQNIAHSHRTGLARVACGVAKPNARFTDSIVIELRASDLINSSAGRKLLAEQHGVSYAASHGVFARKTWKHVA